MEQKNPPQVFLFLFTLLMLALALTAFIPQSPFRKTFALESFGVGVYWDAACTQRIESIDWESLTPGSSTQIQVFVQNEELETPCTLGLDTSAWVPAKAAEYLALSWDYRGDPVEVQESMRVTLVLKVSADIKMITEFNFHIILFGVKYVFGDLNLDGSFDIYDVVEWAVAYGSTPLAPNWNPRADFNSDNMVDIYDAVFLSNPAFL